MLNETQVNYSCLPGRFEKSSIQEISSPYIIEIPDESVSAIKVLMLQPSHAWLSAYSALNRVSVGCVQKQDGFCIHCIFIPMRIALSLLNSVLHLR